MNAAFAALEFHPLIPPLWLAAAGAACAAIIGLALLRKSRGAWARAFAAAAALTALADPRLSQEKHRALPDIVLALVDDSPSQNLGGRMARTELALADVSRQIKAMDGVELLVRRYAGGPDGTRLFAALTEMRAELSGRKPSAEIMITDGRVHDVPALASANSLVPLHLLLTGAHDERDRRLEIVSAPGFALVGKTARITVKLHDPGTLESAPLTVSVDGKAAAHPQIRPGGEITLDVPVAHAGSVIVELSVPTPANDLSPGNNRAAVLISAVRDRLKVLLVSGEPHPGERAWRNLLKSDPAVDLVHFTILRPPEKDDRTPIRELALITFPVRELFEEKLSEFDLVVFDRYRGRGILSQPYFNNIADYVRAGGALLVSSGPESAGIDGADAPLHQILAAIPDGAIAEGIFQPRRTDIGRRHPVSYGLDDAHWGAWLRRVSAQAQSGQVLLQTPDGAPLLVLDRIGKGRTAQLLSDSIWLWARGYDGGGPHDELLRRLAHWLMREPQLEEEALSAWSDKAMLRIEARSLGDLPSQAQITSPDGAEIKTALIDQGDGRAAGSVAAAAPGLWRIQAGGRTALIAVGQTASPELTDPVGDPAPIMRFSAASGGGTFYAQDRIPLLHRSAGRSTLADSKVMALPRRDEFVVEGRTTTPFPPAWALSLVFAAAAILAWKREGE